jgi:transcriptional regulator with XRE-family HTH domain
MVRGLTQGELARLSHISAATLASALAGKPVNMTTALAIASALKAQPPRPELEELLADL